MTMRRHEHFEELISASLTGELSDSERALLDTHLDRCEQCRATLAAFADQRRIVAGVRHVAPPRDLGARVRAGIETGAFAPVPWWRRPVVAFGAAGGGLAAVAGALLAMVLLNGAPDDGQVGVGSGSPEPTVTIAAAPTAVPSVPQATLTASPAPTPVEPSEPPEPAPEPDVYLAYTGLFDNLLLTLRDGRSGETMQELQAPGPAVATELSPNGQFLAYITRLGESGMNELWVTHIPTDETFPGPSRLDTAVEPGETVGLGRSVAGSEFLEHLTWSSDSGFLAYTVADVEGAGPDVWIFDATNGSAWQFSSWGYTYNGSWLGPDQLWISHADTPSSPGSPHSWLAPVTSGEPVRDIGLDAPGLGSFQPLMNPSGTGIIYWRGSMERVGDEWLFMEGGAPYIAGVEQSDGSVEFVDEQRLFADVTIDRDAFTSAGIAWGADSDAYAVWDAEWTGVPQGAGGEYPSIRRVYFGHASDPRNLTEFHAIDAADLPEGASVVDVKVPTGRHLLVTAQMPIGGVMDAPRAHLLLVTRNTGNVADEVQYLPDAESEGWFGPAALDAYWEVVVSD